MLSCVHHHEQLEFFLSLFINNINLIIYRKKKCYKNLFDHINQQQDNKRPNTYGTFKHQFGQQWHEGAQKDITKIRDQ